MKKKKLFPLGLVLVAVFLFFSGFFWWRWATQPAISLKPAPPKIFVIQKGEGLASVANRLEKEGLIKSSLAFKILVLVKGLAGNVQAGDFRLRPSFSIEEIAYILTHGTLDVWLTFPEGWRREEFAHRLASNLEGFDYQEFIKLTSNLEGYLFPDTYLISKEATPTAVIKILNHNFEEKFSSEFEREAKGKGLTKKQVLILASIVERETKYEKDRPIVAGILLKRWRRGWPLQADATVQYALATTICNLQPEDCNWWPKGLTKTDLKIDSPYNTYQYKGLPPTPICNPGLASIKAVINPEDSSYWFYLSDQKGGTHYAETIEEQNENIVKYLP